MKNIKTIKLLLLLTLILYQPTLFAKDKAYLLDGATHSVLTEVHKDIEAGKNNEALTKLNQLVQKEDIKNYDAAVVHQTMGYAASGLNNFELALKHFLKALSYNALPVEVSHKLNFSAAQLLIHLNKPKQGLKYLAKWFANEKKPTADAHILAATAYYYIEDFKQLITHAEKAIAMTSKPPFNWYELLLAAYFETKTYKKLATLLEKIITIRPDKADYWLQLAATYQYLKQDKKALAVQELAYARGLLKNDDVVRLIKNQLYYEMPFKAAQILEKELAIGNLAANQEMLILLADSWLLSKEQEKAKSVLNEIIAKYDDAKTRLRLGQLYIEAEDWKNVINTLDTALSNADATLVSKANLLVGIAQYHSNKLNKASRAFNLALSNTVTADQAKWWLEHIKNQIESEKQS